jgi:hypothetical protein
MSTTSISTDLARQRKYAKSKETEDFDFGLTVADAFVRGIRDIGYRDSGRAFDELIDNGIQAEASKILVAFGFHKTSDSKPTSIAIVDNGHGMDPEMLRLAVIWGGTHRENDRTGFGRYGYGLPSACVSQGQAFTVFSLVEGGEMTAITLDLEEIGEGQYTDDNGRIVVPPAHSAKLPKWLAKTIRDQLGIDEFEHGTVVLIEKLDRLTWKTRNALERHLLQGIGVTYRNFLRHTGIWVGDKRVEPVDPIFTTPGYRFYDLDEDRAEALEDQSFEVKDPDTRRPVGTVKVRYSSIPPSFARVDKNVERGGKRNPRFEILADHNGIIVMREGRQIDVVSQRPWLSVNNDDRYWGCEIDLPATLDEEMSITTSKQRVILSERIWTLLKDQGVLANIAALRKRYDDEKARAKVKRENQAGLQMSGQAMGAAEKFKTDKAPETPERRQKSQQALDREIDRRAEGSGVDRETVKKQVEREVRETPYRATEEALKGAPFFRVEQVGPQKILYLNTAHRFYRDIYAGQESTPRLRAALEIVLFAIGVGEVDAEGDRLLFYETERGAWSTQLEIALAQFEKIDSVEEVREAGEDEATPN